MAQELIEEALELKLELEDAAAKHRHQSTTPGGRQLTLAEQMQQQLPKGVA